MSKRCENSEKSKRKGLTSVTYELASTEPENPELLLSRAFDLLFEEVVKSSARSP